METQKEKAEQHWNKIDTLVVGEMKRVMRQFISTLPTIEPDIKDTILQEIGGNHFDERFQMDRKVNSELRYFCEKYIEEHNDPIKLWRDIAVANASINNDPAYVAGLTTENYVKMIKDRVDNYINNQKE